MEKLFMSAGIVIAIVLGIVGIVKLPFKSFKEKHPQCYKTVFTLLTFVLAIGLAILDEIYILEGALLSLDFVVLITTILAGVFGTYNGVYEGLGLKELMKIITENTKKAKELAKDRKVVEFLNKIEDINKAIALLEERKNNQDSEV